MRQYTVVPVILRLTVYLLTHLHLYVDAGHLEAHLTTAHGCFEEGGWAKLDCKQKKNSKVSLHFVLLMLFFVISNFVVKGRMKFFTNKRKCCK